MGIAPLLNDARRFLQFNFELIKQHPHHVYDFAHVWIPTQSLVHKQYATVFGHTPRVLYGLSQSWESLLHVIQHASEVNSVAFSPDGDRLASGSDEIVRIWNTATGELEHELEGHTNTVWSVAFSHNGHFIVSGSRDKTVRIWNTATCDTRYMLTGHTHQVMSVAISRNDQFMVSGSSRGVVRIWDTAAGEPLCELKSYPDWEASVAISPNCQQIASGSCGEVWIWTKDGVIEHKLECPSEYNEVYDLAFSHDGSRILCNVDRTEWTTTGHHLSLLDTNNVPDITSIAYSPDDKEIVCGMADGRVVIWNRNTDETRELGRHTDNVKSVAISPDGSRIASGSGTVRIWDPRLQGTFTEEMDLGQLGVLSHDGQWIVTTSHSNTGIKLWRVTETITKMTKMNELIVENYVASLALSYDGSRVVIGYEDRSILVWNHLTNKTECRMSGHSGHVACVAFSYDGNHVVSGSSREIQIWDCHVGNEVALYQHSNTVICVTFSHNGGCVAFGSDDTVQIWNPSTGEIHSKPANIVGGGYVSSVAFSHDDSHVIFGWRDGVWIWNVMTNESTMLSERIQLPDGTRVHSLSKGDFHIYDPVDQETTNGIPPYLLSISSDRNWITGEQGEHICWIHPQYRAFTQVHIAKSIVYLQFDFAMIILDLTDAAC